MMKGSRRMILPLLLVILGFASLSLGLPTLPENAVAAHDDSKPPEHSCHDTKCKRGFHPVPVALVGEKCHCVPDKKEHTRSGEWSAWTKTSTHAHPTGTRSDTHATHSAHSIHSVHSHHSTHLKSELHSTHTKLETHSSEAHSTHAMAPRDTNSPERCYPVFCPYGSNLMGTDDGGCYCAVQGLIDEIYYICALTYCPDGSNGQIFSKGCLCDKWAMKPRSTASGNSSSVPLPTYTEPEKSASQSPQSRPDWSWSAWSDTGRPTGTRLRHHDHHNHTKPTSTISMTSSEHRSHAMPTRSNVIVKARDGQDSSVTSTSGSDESSKHHFTGASTKHHHHTDSTMKHHHHTNSIKTYHYTGGTGESSTHHHTSKTHESHTMRKTHKTYSTMTPYKKHHTESIHTHHSSHPTARVSRSGWSNWSRTHTQSATEHHHGSASEKHHTHSTDKPMHPSNYEISHSSHSTITSHRAGHTSDVVRREVPPPAASSVVTISECAHTIPIPSGFGPGPLCTNYTFHTVTFTCSESASYPTSQASSLESPIHTGTGPLPVPTFSHGSHTGTGPHPIPTFSHGSHAGTAPHTTITGKPTTVDITASGVLPPSPTTTPSQFWSEWSVPAGMSSKIASEKSELSSISQEIESLLTAFTSVRGELTSEFPLTSAGEIPTVTAREVGQDPVETGPGLPCIKGEQDCPSTSSQVAVSTAPGLPCINGEKDCPSTTVHPTPTSTHEYTRSSSHSYTRAPTSSETKTCTDKYCSEKTATW